MWIFGAVGGVPKSIIRKDPFFGTHGEKIDRPKKFKEYTRMSLECFEEVLRLVERDKQTTNFKIPISAEERLVVAIR